MAQAFELARSYFIDPARPQTSEDLAQLSADAIRQLAQIYAGNGDVSGILSNTTPDPLQDTLSLMLQREAGTRRFDSNFMGQIHPQGNKIGVLGHLVAAYMNTNTIVKEVSRSEHAMEREVVDWLADMVGYDTTESSGNIVTGGTTANMAGLWVARQAKRKEWNDQRLPTSRRGKPLVFANSMRHYSIEKACDMMDMGLVNLPVKKFKTDIAQLERILQSMSSEKRNQIAALVGVAGETETGLVDDLVAMADIAERYHIHFHVDAAYGGPFILSRAGFRFKGIERADSVVIDPHKMLYIPYQAGAILFKHKEKHALIQQSARYLAPLHSEGVLGDPNIRNFGLAGRVEGSMGVSGVLSTWATIRLLGKEGIASLLDHTLDMAEYAHEKINSSDLFQPVHEPELNTFLIRYRDGTVSRYDELLERIQQNADTHNPSNYIAFNRKVDGGRAALRFIAMHPYTSESHIDDLVRVLEDEAQKLR